MNATEIAIVLFRNDMRVVERVMMVDGFTNLLCQAGARAG